MAWQKGQSGNPRGRAVEKTFRDAVRLAVNDTAKDKKGRQVKKLRLLAERLVDEAIDGNVMALKEVADRLDGKAVQQVDLTVEEVTAEEATDAALNDIIAYHARRGRNGTAKKANGSEEPDSVH